MSTAKEQLEAIGHAILVAEKRLAQLAAYEGPLTRAHEFEMLMNKDCIARGEALLAKLNQHTEADDG